MDLPRRELLLGGAAVLSGCGALTEETPTSTPRPDSDGDGIPDDVDDYPTDPSRAIRNSSATGTPTLEPGDFAAHALPKGSFDGEYILQYEFSVMGHQEVDCLVFEREAYDAYEDGARDVAVMSGLSRVGVTEGSLTERLPAGELILALDYTDQSTPAGSDPVEVEFSMNTANSRDRTTSTR